jgi:hypothetical protein
MRALLAPLVAAKEIKPFDLIVNHAFLARAERALGNEAAAGQFANVMRTTAETIQAPPHVTAMPARFETDMPR